jgi:fructose-1,6-bisphosphatase/inositol monophosphatase family enzyme
MRPVDPDEFVSLITPQLERVAELARRNQAGAKPLAKAIMPDGLEGDELDRASRVGAISTVDLEIQEFLLSFIHDKWPFVSLLAEEETKSTRMFGRDSLYCVLIDPIDGTRNFLAGDLAFCHTISLMEGSAMLASMVYSHQHKALYTAIAGRGAWVVSRGAPSKLLDLDPATGSTVLCHVARISKELIDEFEHCGYDVRPSAQNATDILSMIGNDVAAFISLRPIVYDVWSPAMIVHEAGGWLSDWAAAPLQFQREQRLPHVFVSRSEKEAGKILPILGKHLLAS